MIFILTNLIPYLIILTIIIVIIYIIKRFLRLESKIESQFKRNISDLSFKDKAIRDQNEKIKELEEKINSLVQSNESLVQSNEQNELKIKELNDQMKDVKEELRHTDLEIYLLQNYTTQIEINSNINYQIINLKYEYVLNIYKLLLIRKISNHILEHLFKGDNNKNYFKTKNEFKSENPKGKKFPIIIAKCDIKDIPKNKINQIIDFLMFLKEKCSSIIHFSDKASIFQFEFLTELLGENISKEDEKEKSYLNAAQAISLLFDDLNSKQNVITNLSENKDNDKDENENLFNQIKEELNKIKNEKLNEGKGNIINGLSSNGNHSENSAENTNQSQNNNGNNIFNVIQNILYPDKIQKEIVIDKIDKGIGLLSKIEEAKKKYQNLNLELYDEKKRRAYDIGFLFEEWQKAFNHGYRTQILFKKLVKLDGDTTLECIKNNLIILVPDLKIKIFSEDFHDFSNIGEIISDKEIDNYNK